MRGGVGSQAAAALRPGGRNSLAAAAVRMNAPVDSGDSASHERSSMAENTITMYGAEWCGDCRRTKKQLTELGIDFDYIDLVAEPERADDAKAISGRTNIPVVVYPDGSHQVEPTNPEVETKLKDLALL